MRAIVFNGLTIKNDTFYKRLLTLIVLIIDKYISQNF